ncbi:MAG: hypothetical protein GVY10_01020 [Verrucomicrobia bacterium]|nr:hypothetical protein [Verrucomicrobiota bacterium]
MAHKIGEFRRTVICFPPGLRDDRVIVQVLDENPLVVRANLQRNIRHHPTLAEGRGDAVKTDPIRRHQITDCLQNDLRKKSQVVTALNLLDRLQKTLIVVAIQVLHLHPMNGDLPA